MSQHPIITLALLPMLAIAAIGAHAQPATGQSSTDVIPVDSLLSTVDLGERGLAPDYARYASETQIEEFVNTREQRPAASLDSLLNGLEQFALKSDNDAVRDEAINLLAIFGTKELTVTPLPGMVSRLLRMYPQLHPEQRRTLAGLLPQMEERAGALDLLVRLAQLPAENADFSQAARVGAEGLLAMGPTGEAAIRRIYESGNLGDFGDDVGAYLRLRDMAIAKSWKEPVPPTRKHSRQ